MICNNLEDCKNENAASDVKPLMFVVILWSWAERKITAQLEIRNWKGQE